MAKKSKIETDSKTRRTTEAYKQKSGVLHPGGGGHVGTKVNIPDRPSKSSETAEEVKEWN